MANSRCLAEKIRTLPDTEKIELVDSILMQLDKPDPEIDRMEGNEEIFGKLMSDKDFRDVAVEHLLGKVYKKLNQNNEV